MQLNLNKKKRFLEAKLKKKKPIVCLTAYTVQVAKIVDKYVDLILVGDSLGPVLYGFKSTRHVTVDMMVRHAKAVVENTKNAIVVVDMPFGTYEKSKITALKNAKKILELSGADAVKLEGGQEVADTIKYLSKNKVYVMGHLGMLPQHMNGNYKVYGSGTNEKQQLKKDAVLLEECGVFSIVIECTVKKIVDEVISNLSIPIIGIGASDRCDGQILVTEDLLGLTDFESKFLKRYARISDIIEKSVKKFTDDVKSKKFPKKKNLYS